MLLINAISYHNGWKYNLLHLITETVRCEYIAI